MWVGQVLQGVLLGGYYALLACGLSLMFGVLGIVNLAHGSLAVLGAYWVWTLAERWDLSPFVGLVAVLPAMALVGWLLERWVLARALRSGELVALLSTFGLSVVLDNLLFETFGADAQSLAPNIGDLAFDSWHITEEISVGELPLLTFIVAVALLAGLQLFLQRTPLGRAIRATAEDPDTAELVGVDSRQVYAIATAVALVTVGLAGAFWAMRATVDPYAGSVQLLFAFEAVVIGRVGSLWGTLGGGIVLGIAQNLGSQISPQGFLIAGHAVFLLILGARLLLDGQTLRNPVRALPARST
jgi:branched-chain amino acid transport system permease protein